MTTTEAAVLEALGAPLRLMELRLPELRTGQVSVEVAYSGVCHTQLLEVQGKRGPDRFLPHALGHEGSGVVAGVGPGVQKVKPGDHVVLSWIKGSGADVSSSVYASESGPVNAGAITTFMRATVVSENRVTPIPTAVPLREAALLGCAVSTGVGAVLNAARVHPGSTVAIFGMGGIGLCALLAADLAHASAIIAVDVLDTKLGQARALGATHTVNARLANAAAEVRSITSGVGVDYAIEAVGRPETMEAAIESVRDGGGTCVLAGNVPHGQKMQLDPFHLIRGRRIIGTWGGNVVPDRDIPTYARLFSSGRLRLSELPTRDFSLREINEAFSALERGDVGRALIEMAA